MKKVAILSNYYHNFTYAEVLKIPYQRMTHAFRYAGLEIIRVSMHSFDREKGIFLDYIDMNENGEFVKIEKEVRPDIVWNRSADGIFFCYDQLQKFSIPFFPSGRLMSIEGDKYEMNLFLKAYQPITVLLKDFLDSPHAREKFTQPHVILKPIRSNSGKGIILTSCDEIFSKRKEYIGLENMFIVQEFKDFSKGIPNIVESKHDLRVVYIGGKVSYATVRVPPVGSFKSNVGGGGTEFLLPITKIPHEVLEMGETIIRELELEKSNIFSFDYGYVKDEDRWYIFEMNSSPSFWLACDDIVAGDILFNAYSQDIISLIRSLV